MSSLKGNRQDRLKASFLGPGGKISRRELLRLASPLGKLELDGSKCTGCGLCALDCPTGALSVSPSGENGYRLFFRHGWCVACGRCLEVCPEQCLSLERTLELDKMDSPPAVLFEDSVARCRRCGRIIGSRAMIDRLKGKLSKTRDNVSPGLELCPECKAEAVIIQMGAVLEPVIKSTIE